MKGKTESRVQLHKTLWERADHFGRLEIYQKKLAEELQVTQATMCLIIKDLTMEGRIRKFASRRRNIGVYTIRDPNEFPHYFNPAPVVPGLDVVRCIECGELEKYGRHSVYVP